MTRLPSTILRDHLHHQHGWAHEHVRNATFEGLNTVHSDDHADPDATIDIPHNHAPFHSHGVPVSIGAGVCFCGDPV